MFSCIGSKASTFTPNAAKLSENHPTLAPISMKVRPLRKRGQTELEVSSAAPPDKRVKSVTSPPVSCSDTPDVKMGDAIATAAKGDYAPVDADAWNDRLCNECFVSGYDAQKYRKACDSVRKLMIRWSHQRVRRSLAKYILVTYGSDWEILRRSFVKPKPSSTRERGGRLSAKQKSLLNY